ncbi:MAG: SDR family oxidoreductase [Myxococcales bacterium]|nr:SDR family oxidoreductase [Myxococcales bacterium]
MVVWITGASGGLGRVLGATLVSEGMSVYGTARDPAAHDAPFPLLPMEVTDAASVARCVEEIVGREGRIDVVVNCVNRMIIGGFEEQSVEEVRALYDTNVFGVLRVCQAVLPILRKQGGGTIVNMSSLGGLLAVPFMSAYTSAKFAMEALSEALHHEVRDEGIDVVILQPVAMAMDRPATGAHLSLVAGAKPDSRSHAMLERMARDTAESRLGPEQVAAKILELIRSDRKPLRVPMDRARVLSWLKRLAPQSLIDRLLRDLLK